MSLLDDAKKKFDEMSKDVNVDDLKQKASDLGYQAKDLAKKVDVPGTDLDDKLKEKLGLDDKK